MMALSPHFTLEELCASDYATRHGICNTPTDPNVLENLGMLAQGLERLRDVLSMPIHVNSGYRCGKLNSAVGGAKNSAHLEGRAADITCAGFGSPAEVALVLLAHQDYIDYDQLIMEGGWVHIAFADKPRHMVLTAHFGNGPTTYTPGLA